MNEITTETLVVECRQAALSRAEQMGSAGFPERGRRYADLSFDTVSPDTFECRDPNAGGLDLLDMILDEVKARHPIEFHEHREDAGKQTILWHRV